MKATPKSLKQAFNNARRSHTIGQADCSYQHIKDFLAQKFTAAYMRAESEAELKRLETLWQNIVVEVDDVR